MTSAVAQFYIFIRTSCGNSWDAAVSCIDSNGDGIVTKGELRTFLSDSDTFEYQPAEFEDIWQTIDTHTKGNIGNSKVKNLNAVDSSEGAVVQRQIQRYGKLNDAVEKALEQSNIDYRVLERIGGEDKLKYLTVTKMANDSSIMNNIENLSVDELIPQAKDDLLKAVKELIHGTLTNNTRYTCYTQGLTGPDGNPYSLKDDSDLWFETTDGQIGGLIGNYLSTITSLGELSTDIIDNVEKIIQAYLKSAGLGNFDNPDMNGLENFKWNDNTKLNELQFANFTRKYNNALVISQLILIEPFDKFKNNQTKLAQVIKEFMVYKQNEWKTLTQPVNFNQLYNVNDDNIREELKSFAGFITALEELNNPTTGGNEDTPQILDIDGISTDNGVTIKEQLQNALKKALGNKYTEEIFYKIWNMTKKYCEITNLTANDDIDQFIKVFKALYEIEYDLRHEGDEYIQLNNIPASSYQAQIHSNGQSNNETTIKHWLQDIYAKLVKNNGPLMKWAERLCYINVLDFKEYKDAFNNIALDLRNNPSKFSIPSGGITEKELADQYVELFSKNASILVQKNSTDINDYKDSSVFASKINIFNGIKMRDFTNFTKDFNSAVKTNFTSKITYPGEDCGYTNVQWGNAVTTLENYLGALFEACHTIDWNKGSGANTPKFNEQTSVTVRPTFKDANGNERDFNNLTISCYNGKFNNVEDGKSYFENFQPDGSAKSGMYIVCDYNASIFERNRFYIALDGNTMWNLFTKFLGY